MVSSPRGRIPDSCSTTTIDSSSRTGARRVAVAAPAPAPFRPESSGCHASESSSSSRSRRMNQNSKPPTTTMAPLIYCPDACQQPPLPVRRNLARERVGSRIISLLVASAAAASASSATSSAATSSVGVSSSTNAICVVGSARVINNRVVDGRLIDFTTNTCKLLAQCCKFVVPNFDQRLLLRYIGSLELGDAMLNLLFSSQRLIVSVSVSAP